MTPRITLYQASRRGLSLLAALGVLFGAPLLAQEVHNTHDHGPLGSVLACGEVTPPPVALVWQEAAQEDSRTTLSHAEATLLLTNRTEMEWRVEVEITLEPNSSEEGALVAGTQLIKYRPPALRIDGGATETLVVSLDRLGDRLGSSGTSFVSAHAWISDPTREAKGEGLEPLHHQSASPVLYLKTDPEGALTALGEAALRQAEEAQVLFAAATTGAADLPEGVTLEMAFEAGEGELRGAVIGPDDEELEKLERSLEVSNKKDDEMKDTGPKDSSDEEMER